MRKIISLLALLFPVLTFAQGPVDFNHYASVPMVDGQIVFEQYVKADGLDQKSVFKKCFSCVELLMAKNDVLKDKKGNVIDGGKSIFLSNDSEKGVLDLRFETPFSFSGTGIGKTKAIMSYFLGVKAEDGGCRITVKAINYYYTVSDGTFERFSAEDSITDKDALNKDKTKLTNYYGSLRVETIDRVDEIVEAFKYALE